MNDEPADASGKSEAVGTPTVGAKAYYWVRQLIAVILIGGGIWVLAGTTAAQGGLAGLIAFALYIGAICLGRIWLRRWERNKGITPLM